MNDIFNQIKAKQGEAETLKTKGDARLKRDLKGPAFQFYQEGVQKLTEALTLSETISAPDRELRIEQAEMFGSLGGLLQRLGRPDEALDSYKKGGGIERELSLPSTYNRLNVIKSELLTGRKTLQAVSPDLRNVSETIDKAVDEKPSLGDSGWIWADLGDSLALLGHLDRAQSAYQTFILKSETKSPERTLDVLRQVAKVLNDRGDPDAGRVEAAIGSLALQLQANAQT